MKTIGILGGMSWESTVSYYQIINETVKEKLGGLHSAKILLHSVDFAQIEACQQKGEWALCGEILAKAAVGLEKAGADFLLIATNTMHKVFDQIQSSVNIPVLHIAKVTSEALLADGVQKVALLGTKYTMEQDFYKKILLDDHLQVLVPSAAQRECVNRIIFQELCRGELKAESREEYKRIIKEMADAGAQACILGCTEIGLLIGQQDVELPLYDTTLLHARAAAMQSISDD